MATTKKNAAAAQGAAAANLNNANHNNAAAIETGVNTENTTTTDAKQVKDLAPVEVVALSAEWVKQYGTISAIRGNYATLVDTYGKKNFDAVLSHCKTIRQNEIAAAAAQLEKDVFTYDGILSAVFAAVAKSQGYANLCGYAKRVYTGENGKIAAAVIKDYFTNVDSNGLPLAKVNYINAAGTEIYTVFEGKKLTYANAVTILKTSLDGMKTAAVNAATRKDGNDAETATRKNVRTVSKVVAVYAAAIDETGAATLGERRDTSKDERTKKNAAAVLGLGLPVGCVSVVAWNAAAKGNEDAAALVEDAKNAAKDAAKIK